MLTNKTKSYLSILVHLKPTPSFFALYAFIWLVWHNEFIITLITHSGDVFQKLHGAVEAITYNQYIFVFMLTVFVILLRYGFDYIAHLVNDEEQSNDPNLLINSHHAATEKETDIKRVIAALDETREQLSVTQANVKKLKQEKQELVGKLLKCENKIDEISADKVILQQDNIHLKNELKKALITV